MNLVDLGLWVILVLLIALVPCGCILTRSPPPKQSGPAE